MSEPTKQARIRERMEIANEVIRIIASHGRRFFSQDSDCRTPMKVPRISHFEMRNGRLWFIDKHTNKPIFVHYEPRWRGGRWRHFSDGGTLHSLVEHLRDFILGKREGIAMQCFGPWPEWVCGGDLWGYGDSMAYVRAEIETLMTTSELMRVGTP